ncbi:hypothetical protein A0J48_025970 [Sphaerospermopsis aphanizomenoides BCCUSP55]|nr:hypothetical protein [Sphaerospermopsis aphanizomenoides BCCUSP55]
MSNHYLANYLFGRLLLQRDDRQGIEYIEKAISQSHKDFIDGCSLIYAFLKKQGDMKAAYAYQDSINKHYELIWLAKQERSSVDSKDEFQAANLSREIIDILCEKLAQHSNLKTAYLAQKFVQYFPEEPFYVLGVVHTWRLIELDGSNQKFINEIVNSLAGFPGYIYVILLNNDNKSLQKKLRQVPDAIIYQKS